MKREISASSQYTDYTSIQHGKQRFSVHYSFNGPYEGSFVAQISEIHPYDDADYVWAKINANGRIDYIKNGRVIDRAQLPDYIEEDYEDVNEYYNEMIDMVAVDIMDMNRSIKPVMIHN